jgi:hypothetical protein
LKAGVIPTIFGGEGFLQGQRKAYHRYRMLGFELCSLLIPCIQCCPRFVIISLPSPRWIDWLIYPFYPKFAGFMVPELTFCTTAMRNWRENERKRWRRRTTLWKTMWRLIRPERSTSFQMRHPQGTFPIALSTSSPSCASAPRIGLVPPVPHWVETPPPWESDYQRLSMLAIGAF